MTTNLILTLIIILAIAVIALILNRRNRLMTIPKSPPRAAEWWSSLNQQWQAIFKAAIRIKSEPTGTELVTILNLTKLDCHRKKLTSLEPLRALTGLQTLDCSWNHLTSLEPLQACPGLQSLNCSVNHLTSLEPLWALTGLQTLDCWSNRLTSLEPLHGLKSLKNLECENNPSLSQAELERFKNNRWFWWSSLDAPWQAIFKAAIGINSEPTAEELVTILSLTQLKCNLRGLTSLEPLRALTGLQALYCSFNQLTSLEPLQACLGLQALYCSFNQLTSLEPLRACTNLRTLNCWNNRLTNLEPLRALTGLQTLNCSSNKLTSLEPLHGLKNLKKLECRNNPSLSQAEIEYFLTKNKRWWSSLDAQWQAIFKAAIGIKSEPTEDELVAILSLTKLDCHGHYLTNLEPLWALTGLQTLDCSDNPLTSLEPLRALTGLQTLNCYCWDNQLTNLEPLHGLKSLKKLTCGSNLSLSQPELEGFLTNKKRCWWSLLNRRWQAIFKEAIGINSEPTETELETILSLTQLDCSGKGLANLEPLRALTGLQSLDCSNNDWLTSLEPLRALTGLQTLNCSNNCRLTNLEPLWALTGLQTLDCSWNPQLTSLEPLRALTGLQTLNCSVNQLTSLEGLQGCTRLQSLDCHNNPLTSLEPLRACTGLQTLNCSLNRLTSLEPLRACTGLQTLDCRYNPLISLEPLHGLKSLKNLVGEKTPSLSEPEIERFKQAVPSCQDVHWVGSGLIVPPQVDKLTNNRQSWWSSLDWKWQAIFREAIGINSNPTETELETILSLTKLNCRDKGLTSLEPLQACMGLQTLDCSENQLTNLEGLQALTGLQTLSCGLQFWKEDEFYMSCGNHLTSLEPLRACPGLQTLHCHSNQLTSLEPLRACPGLQTLACSSNRLTSLEPLQACPGLQSLNCSHNHLTSLEPLRACPGLQSLSCGGNQLTSLEPLRACTGLQSLYCSVNQLTSLEGLQALTGLQTLHCSYNQLTSLEGLQASTGLQTLHCWHNRLTSLDGLRGYLGLQTLNCQQNQLTNLDGLQGCTGLQTLNCDGNKLTSLEGLRTCTGLQFLYCDGNQLTSLEGLYGLKSLKQLYYQNNPSLSQAEIERFKNNRWFWWSSLDWQWQAIFKAAIGINSEPTEDELVVILSLTQLDCSGKSLTSLKPLRALTGLQTLNCSSNRISFSSSNGLTSLEGLQGCTGLQTLNCSHNYLTSLEPLHGLKSLKNLDCRSNPPLSVQEIERFEKAMPSCRVFPTANDLRQEEIEAAKLREQAELREQIEAAKLRKQIMTAKGIDKIVPANNNFSFRLFDQLLQQSQGQNIFISPLSVALALAMTYNGAAGNTQTVMAKTLGLENLSLEEVNQANLALRNFLLHQPNVSLLIANSLWLRQDFRLEPAFVTPTQQYYAANVTNADFQSPATISNINQWVNANTQGNIGPMVQTLDPLTVLLLINAIYFKGTWNTQFDRNDTRNREFTLLTGKKKLTPMMYQSSGYHYYQGPNYQAIRLPYQESSLNMTIFLPDPGIPLENFPLFDHWQEWQTGGDLREGTIVLPRFQAEYQVTLNEAIKAMGMTEAFSQDQADFSQMAKVQKERNIYISEVKHQTFVEVNEEGTVAAAMSYDGVGEMAEPEPEPFEMIIDHPFLFTIQDDSTGTVLFLGAIVEPK